MSVHLSVNLSFNSLARVLHWYRSSQVQVPARVNFFQAYSFCNCTSFVFNAIIVFVFLHIFFLSGLICFFFLKEHLTYALPSESVNSTHPWQTQTKAPLKEGSLLIKNQWRHLHYQQHQKCVILSWQQMIQTLPVLGFLWQKNLRQCLHQPNHLFQLEDKTWCQQKVTCLLFKQTVALQHRYGFHHLLLQCQGLTPVLVILCHHLEQFFVKTVWVSL